MWWFKNILFADDVDVPSLIVLSEGDFVVPTVAHGPRIGLQALLSPALVKGKRRPRLFVGANAGPSFHHPQWGEVAVGTSVVGIGGTVRSGEEASAGRYGGGPFVVDTVTAGAEATATKIFVDVQAFVGVQVRL